MPSWVETWAGPDAPSWPEAWSTRGNVGSATVVGGRGRLTAGPGQYEAHRARLERMTEQRDVEVLLTFVPQVNAEWYLTVGSRTPSNDPAFTNWAFTPRGMFVQVGSILGSQLSFVRWDDSGYFTEVAKTRTGLPEFAAGSVYRLRMRVQSIGIYAKVWAASSPEPAAWSLVHTDTAAWMRPGKVTVAYTTNTFGDVSSIDVDDLTVTGLDPEPALPAGASVRHDWAMWSRDMDYKPDEELPIVSAQGVLRHLGVSSVVAVTRYSEARWASLGPGRGLILTRDGQQYFSGRMVARELDWDAENQRMTIKIEAKDELVLLDDLPAFPDPTRAPDDQTVNDYWNSTGVVPGSTAMRQLILDQIGPTAHVTRRNTAVSVATDPVAGASRQWSELWDANGSVLGTLAKIAVISGQGLGLRASTAPGSIMYTIVSPRDLSGSVKFSVSFGNVAGLRYREAAPQVTDAVSAGQGDLHLRMRRYAATASTLALAWARRIWRYIDRRDTADIAELDKANAEALAEGDVSVSFTASLLDTPGATYRQDYDLGDRVTVFVRVPGQETPVAEVVDVIREIAFEIGAAGVERITPAIGSYDAKAVVPTPTQQQLALVGQSLAATKRK